MWWESVPGRLEQAAYIISLQQPLHLALCDFDAVLFSTVLSSVCAFVQCARILTLQLADTCVSAACSPNTCLLAPAGYKAFSNQRQLLSDQDCFSANVIRLEASTMALLRIIGECSVKCSVIKISDDDISGNTRKVSITAITSTSSRKNAKLIY